MLHFLLVKTHLRYLDYNMKQDVIESISKMIVNGNRLDLPQDEQFTNYPAVKKAMIAAGGKYNKSGFIFKGEVQPIKDRLIGGESINDKKKYQFFETPNELAIKIVGLAEVDSSDHVLEPSAGQGAISDVVKQITDSCTLVELMNENVQILEQAGNDVIESDFLKLDPNQIGMFDKIIANPPFSNNQDIDHIKHMYQFLKPCGKLVSLAGRSWIHGSTKKQVAFRDWIDEMGGTITELEAGLFKQSGTNIRTVIVEIEHQQ